MALSIFSSVAEARSPQYHDQATRGLSVTSPEAALAVALTVSPTDSFPDLSSLTEEMLTEPAAAILPVARVRYVLSPTFAARLHLTCLPSQPSSSTRLARVAPAIASNVEPSELTSHWYVSFSGSMGDEAPFSFACTVTVSPTANALVVAEPFKKEAE